MTEKNPYQTLKGLKKKSYILWGSLQGIDEWFGDEFDALYARFKQEMRKQFGDLRYKANWERAWVHLTARHIYEFTDNSVELIQLTFTTCPQREGWDHLLPQILDEYLRIPGTIDYLKCGFERIVQMNPDASFTQEKALLHAIQEAAQRLESAAHRGSLPIAS